MMKSKTFIGLVYMLAQKTKGKKTAFCIEKNFYVQHKNMTFCEENTQFTTRQKDFLKRFFPL